MGDEIELVGDGDGLVAVGGRSAVERFLDYAGLSPDAVPVSLGKLSGVLRSGSAVAETASGIVEQSAFYLRLTPESARRLRDAGGLMKTKADGISHAMLGDPGKVSKWLQVEDGPASLLTNPAVLSGVGGLMSQLAQQSEAHELKALLVRMDEKLDDVRRAQRDAVLAKMNRAAAAIEEAMTLREHGGDPETLWSKVSGEAATVLEVQNAGLLALGALADKVDGKRRSRELTKATQEIEHQVAVQLAILGRCFELQDQFGIVELDHVLATAPENLKGHRRGVSEARRRRREAVLERTRRLMEQMDAAGGVANANILLHAKAARSVIDSLNTTAEIIDEFHAPLGIESSRDQLSVASWGSAFRDPQKLKRAGAEVGQKAALVGGTVAALAIGAASARNALRGKD
jgi:hypothetical protein